VKPGGAVWNHATVFPILLPLLRECKGDISVLVEPFARAISEQNGWRPKTFTAGATHLRYRARWPRGLGLERSHLYKKCAQLGIDLQKA
jgi:DNA-binding NtrC family response regulator